MKRFLLTSQIVWVLAVSMAEGLFAQDASAQEQKSHAKHRRYTVVDLGTLGGPKTNSNGFGVNAAGWVAGSSNLVFNGPQRAFIWYGLDRLFDLGALDGSKCLTCNSIGYSPNASGEAAITSETSKKDPNGEDFCFYGTHHQCLAAIWRDGSMAALPTLPGGHNASAFGLNDQGQVVGFSEKGTPDPTCVMATPYQKLRFEAVVWETDGEIRKLRPLPGDTVSVAVGINDNGQAVGWSGLCSNTTSYVASTGPFAPHAVLWDSDGSPTDLGHLKGERAGVYNVATTINNRGEVGGWACVGPDTNPVTCIEHAFLWTREKGMQDLGIFPGAIANGPPCCNTISNKGEIVGTAIAATPAFPFNEHALVRQGNEWVELNTLIPADSGWYLVCAQGVNDAGEITGFGVLNGYIHAYLARPTCE